MATSIAPFQNNMPQSKAVDIADKAQRIYNKHFKNYACHLSCANTLLDTYIYEFNHNRKSGKITVGAEKLAHKILCLVSKEMKRMATYEPERFVTFMQNDCQYIEFRTNRVQLADLLTNGTIVSSAGILDVSKEERRKLNDGKVRTIHNYLLSLSDKAVEFPFICGKVNFDVEGNQDENGRGGFILQVNKWFAMPGTVAKTTQKTDITPQPTENTQSYDNQDVSNFSFLNNGKNLQESVTLENKINEINFLFSQCLDENLGKNDNNLFKAANAENNNQQSSNKKDTTQLRGKKIKCQVSEPQPQVEISIVANAIAQNSAQNSEEFMKKALWSQAYELWEESDVKGDTFIQFSEFCVFVAQNMKEKNKKTPTLTQVWREIANFLTYYKNNILQGDKPYKPMFYFFDVRKDDKGFITKSACAWSIYTTNFAAYKERQNLIREWRTAESKIASAKWQSQQIAYSIIEEYLSKNKKFGSQVTVPFLKTRIEEVVTQIRREMKQERFDAAQIANCIEILHFNLLPIIGSQTVKFDFKKLFK